MSDRPLFLYHGGCRDGFAAAWACYCRFPHAEFLAVTHGETPPLELARGRDVVVVDFSYPRAQMQQLADVVASMLVMDHHKTAEEALRGFTAPNVRVVFDMERSGAGLAWDEYFPGEPRPWLVSYAEDRDLWRYALPDSRAVNAYISVLAFDFPVWNTEHATDNLEDAVRLGAVVECKTAQYVREVAKNARWVTFEGYRVPLVNAPQVDVSELLEHLCKAESFSMGFWQRADGKWSYGLRSRTLAGEQVDVSEIAKRHGGGGHKGAAGFQTDSPLAL